MTTMLPQVLPWLFGVCIYVLHKIIFSPALRGEAAPVARKKDEDGIEEGPGAPPASSSPADPEPDAEPEAEEDGAYVPPSQPEDNTPRKLRRKLILACLVFMGGTAAITAIGRPYPVHDSRAADPLPENVSRADPQAEMPAPALEPPELGRPLQDMQPDSNALAAEAMKVDADCVAPQPLAAAPVLTITLTRQGGGTHSPDDFVRSAYYGTLEIGTPPVPFTVVFDTGSGHLIVPSTYCPSATCREHKRFRPKASRTSKDINKDGSEVFRGQPRDQITVGFGTGQVTGVFVEDVVCAADIDTSAFINESQGASRRTAIGCLTMRMIAATDMSDDPFKDFQFDGILGLGLNALSQSPEFNFVTMVSRQSDRWAGFGLPRMFAVFLADSDGEDSEIALGGWAGHHLREDLSWTPVFEPAMGHWLVNIRSIRVDDEPLEFCADGCRAAVDTGTSLLAVPTAIFPELYERLRSPAPLAGHCASRGPQLHFEFDNFTVTLGPKEYASLEPTNEVYEMEFPEPEPQPQVVKQKSSAVTASEKLHSRSTRPDLRCVPMLMTLELPAPLGPKLFVLGEPVLRKYYTVYDAQEKQVGFGRAKHARVTRREDTIMDDDWPGMSAAFGSKATPTMFDVFRWRRERRWALR